MINELNDNKCFLIDVDIETRKVFKVAVKILDYLDDSYIYEFETFTLDMSNYFHMYDENKVKESLIASIIDIINMNRINDTFENDIKCNFLKYIVYADSNLCNRAKNILKSNQINICCRINRLQDEDIYNDLSGVDVLLMLEDEDYL